jgi:hypothetical protein
VTNWQAVALLDPERFGAAEDRHDRRSIRHHGSMNVPNRKSNDGTDDRYGARSCVCQAH